MQEFMTVTQLNQYINRLMERDARLQDCWIKGEISGCKLYQQSGHLYFTLKDENSAVSCVMFKSRVKTLDFKPGDGQEVFLRGYIAVFQRQGRYQFYAQEMQPYGMGGLLLLLEQMKKNLEEKGYFDPEKKKSIPPLVNRVGIVTSQDGAALRDMVRIIRQRHGRAEIILAHSAVQGREAPAELAAAVNLLNRQAFVDVIIIGRGGGSIEDLMAFNSEEVVEAIYHSNIPVISAVGHEIDFTLADLAADLRAATPTQAAQLAVPDLRGLEETLQNMEQRIFRTVQRRMLYLGERLDRVLMKAMWKEPGRLLQQRGEQLRSRQEDLQRAMREAYQTRAVRFSLASRSLDNISPLKIMNRGFAIVSKEGRVVHGFDDVEAGDCLTVSIVDADLQVKLSSKERITRWKA